MIPIIALAGSLNGVMSLFVAGRLYLSYRKTRSAAQGYFLLFYLYFGVFYLYFAGSQLIFAYERTGTVIGIFNVVSYFFLYFSLGYLLSFPLVLNDQEVLAQRMLVGALILSVVFLAVRISHFQPSVQEVVGRYVYWRSIYPTWMRVVTGLLATGVGLYVSAFFFMHGRKHKENLFIFYRSLWLGAGVLVFAVAALLAFVVSSTGSFFAVGMGNALVFLGLVLIMRGVYYRKHDMVPMGSSGGK